MRMVVALNELAKSKGITLAELSLAWILARKEYIVPIPGARHPDRVSLNAAAADIVLSEGDLARMLDNIPTGAIGGRGM